MKITEYKIRIINWPTRHDGYDEGIIDVFRDKDGTDLAVRFLCPCGRCKIYIPFGADNNEPGNEPRKLHWIKKDEIISITPSIELRNDCKEHFYITNNKVI